MFFVLAEILTDAQQHFCGKELDDHFSLATGIFDTIFNDETTTGGKYDAARQNEQQNGLAWNIKNHDFSSNKNFIDSWLSAVAKKNFDFS